ncbi:MAG: HAD family acid phosphatase [Acidobacteriota bacterium]
MKRSLTLLLATLTFAGCASAPVSVSPPEGATPTTSPAPTATPMPSAVHWFRDSAEQQAAYLEIYAVAARTVTASAPAFAAGSWAVILDADETVIDNSQYEKELWQTGKGTFDEALWASWVARQSAPPLPGAREFLNLVHSLGGKIAIVTNRSEATCEATRANFSQQSLPFDVMLCRGADGDKNPRFQAVEKGGTALGPLHVVLWIGDNIRDFPTLDQKARFDPERLGAFGTRFFMLPNPMYGSWEKNPEE